MPAILSAIGTSAPYFKIGKAGATIYQGLVPVNAALNNGDVWIDTERNLIHIWSQQTEQWAPMAKDTRAIRTISSSTTLLASDDIILANGAITLTLPEASVVGATKIFVVKRISDDGPVIVATSGNNTIDGNTTVLINAKYTSITIVTDSSNYWVI